MKKEYDLPYKNLRDFITRLENEGELIRIKEYVNPVLEIAEVADRMAKSKNGGKALLFENTGTEFPLLINAFGSDRRICMALGVDKLEDIPERIDSLFKKVTNPKQGLWSKLQMLPTLKDASSWMPAKKMGKGECQEVVIKDPDLSALPILKSWSYDGGRFVTLPLVHTIDPDNGTRNAGMYRMQVFTKTSTGMHWHMHKTGARHYEAYKKLGKQMPVAVALGGDPAYTYAATAPMPDNLDEYLLAGFLRNKKVELVRCLTQPEILVPSDVDFVIEGYVDTAEPKVTEGPFGDHTGFYSLEDLYPTFHVTCITHRTNPVYPATIVGIPPQEDVYLAKATERIFLSPIKIAIAPDIVDMVLPMEGVSHNIAVVKIEKRYPGQGVKVANALWGAGQMMLNKIVVVVSGSVDIQNPAEIANALHKNFDPTCDLHFGTGPLDVLDHAAQTLGLGGKLCIDATEKLDSEKNSSPVNGKTYTHLHQLVHKSEYKCEADAKIVALFDDNVDLNDLPTAIWLLGNNIDVSRDCKVENGSLTIDATAKRTGENGINRPWPNIVCSSMETIKAIDEKWDSLNLGEHTPSPSLKYQHLLYKGNASVDWESQAKDDDSVTTIGNI